MNRYYVVFRPWINGQLYSLDIYKTIKADSWQMACTKIRNDSKCYIDISLVVDVNNYEYDL